MTITLRALNRATLARQQLLERTDGPLPALVSRLGGLQAQWPKPPFVGLLGRVVDFEAADLAKAFQSKKLVRATLWRGTIHVVTAQDFRWQRKLVVGLLAKAAATRLRGRSEHLDVAATVQEARRLLEKEPMTFGDLRERLVKEFPKAEGRALGFTVRMHVPLVMMPTDDTFCFPQDAKFALADDVDTSETTPKNLERMVEQFLGAFGPASVVDAQTWSGVGGLAKTFEAMRERLVTFQLGKQLLFDLPQAPRPAEDVEAPLRILQEFDNLLLAYKDRSRLFDAADKNAIYASGLRVLGTVLVEGRCAATWRVDREKKVGVFSASPFGKLSKKTLEILEKEALPVARLLAPEATSHTLRIEGKKSSAGS